MGYNRPNYTSRILVPWEVCPNINTALETGCFQRRDGAFEVIDAIKALEGFHCRFRVLILDGEAILRDTGGVSQSQGHHQYAGKSVTLYEDVSAAFRTHSKYLPEVVVICNKGLDVDKGAEHSRRGNSGGLETEEPSQSCSQAQRAGRVPDHKQVRCT